MVNKPRSPELHQKTKISSRKKTPILLACMKIWGKILFIHRKYTICLSPIENVCAGRQ